MSKDSATPTADTAKINKSRGPGYASPIELYRSMATAGPVPNEMHPWWCEQTSQCTARTRHDWFQHAGEHAEWSPVTDDVVISLDVFRRDEFNWRTGQQKHDRPRVKLDLRNTADGTQSAVEVGVKDLDLLITFLQRMRTTIAKPFPDIERSVDPAPFLAAHKDEIRAERERAEKVLAILTEHAPADDGVSQDDPISPHCGEIPKGVSNAETPLVVDGHVGPGWATSYSESRDAAGNLDALYWSTETVELPTADKATASVGVMRTDSLSVTGRWAQGKAVAWTDGGTLQAEHLAALRGKLSEVQAILDADQVES